MTQALAALRVLLSGALLAKARSAIPDRPENSSEMSNVMQIVSAYANIDSDEAFRLIAGLIPQINELTNASIIVYGFQGGSNIRQGEMMMTHGNSFGFHLHTSILTRLAEKDPDKALRLIDGFARRETRILLKLQLAESGQFRPLIVDLRRPRSDFR